MTKINSEKIIQSIQKIENKIHKNSIHYITLKNLEDFYITTPINEIYKNLEISISQISKHEINFIELGSSINRNGLLATAITEQNNKKLNYFGIEKFEDLRKLGNDFMQLAINQKIVNSPNIKTATGNYLHPLIHNNSAFQEMGTYKKIKLLSNFENKNSHLDREFHIPTKQILDFSKTKENPYIAINAKLESADLLYTYTWGPEIPYIAKLFSEYANKDSILLITSRAWPANTKELMQNLNLNIKKQDTFMEYVGIIDKIPHIVAKITKK